MDRNASAVAGSVEPALPELTKLWYSERVEWRRDSAGVRDIDII
jgi:hypothetical protein